MSKNKIKLFDFASRLGVGVNTVIEVVKKRGLIENPSPNARLDFLMVEQLLRTEFSREYTSANGQALIEELREEPSEKSTPKEEVKDNLQETDHKVKIELKVLGSINDNKEVVSPKIITVEDKSNKEPLSDSENEERKEKIKENTEEVKSDDVEVVVKESKEPTIPIKEEVINREEPSDIKIQQEVNSVEAQVVESVEKDENDGIFRPSTPVANIQFNVVGKIDLSTINDATRPSRKSSKERKEDRKKRQRVKEAVDVKAEAAKLNQDKKDTAGTKVGNTHNNAQTKQQNAMFATSNKRAKTKVKDNKPKNIQPQVSEEDVQRQVKETLARLTGKSNQNAKGAKYRRDKRDAARSAADVAAEVAAEESKVLKLTEFVTVSDLAGMMDVPVAKVIGTCMSLGLMVSINMRLDAETIEIVAEEFGFSTSFVTAEVAEALNQLEEDNEDDLISRPPIVTVMGHVDHGKTSLLDRLRNTNIIEGEAGGITQHIGAYSLKLSSGKRITFLDTPGHEAFTAMRARGAKITDIAIIIVAADDDVMPQTKEAINHAAAAGVPIVFAINKIDKPGANPDRIREQLAAMNYLVEEWGGKYQCQEISAKQGLNLDELLEKVLLEAEILELKANPKRRAIGSIIESSLDKGRGYVATMMVQGGTLRVGDIVLSGTHFGKVKAMFNERNQPVDEAGPSTPVLILGLDGAPTAGENFNVMETEQEARAIANKREQFKREQDNRAKRGLTLDELARRRALGNFQELNVIVKGDVDGSIEALSDSLIRLSAEEIQVNVIHKGVGAISESDVVLASASSAIIVGFQVRPSQAARRLAEREGVEIRTYSIIYDTIEDIKNAIEGMLAPEIKENVVANLEVQQTFKISKVGTIAGCIVVEGKIKRNNKIRLIRDGIVKYQGALGSLKRFKDDAKEVVMGQDCGLNIEGYNDIMVGDMIEAYEEIEIKKTLG